MATACALFGEQMPDGVGEDNFDFLPYLLDQKPDGPAREAIVSHDYFGRYAIQQGPWKLVRFETPQDEEYLKRYPPEPPELLNVVTDISETTDLAGQHPERVEQLSRLLEKARLEGYTRPR